MVAISRFPVNTNFQKISNIHNPFIDSYLRVNTTNSVDFGTKLVFEIYQSKNGSYLTSPPKKSSECVSPPPKRQGRESTGSTLVYNPSFSIMSPEF